MAALRARHEEKGTYFDEDKARELYKAAQQKKKKKLKVKDIAKGIETVKTI